MHVRINDIIILIQIVVHLYYIFSTTCLPSNINSDYISKTSKNNITFAASCDKTIKLWDMDDWALLTCLEEGLDSPVTSLALSNDNTFILAGN